MLNTPALLHLSPRAISTAVFGALAAADFIPRDSVPLVLDGLAFALFGVLARVAR
jgi:hypothetical protein